MVYLNTPPRTPYGYILGAARLANTMVGNRPSTAYGRSYNRFPSKRQKTVAKRDSVKAQMLRVIDNHHSTMDDNNYLVTSATQNTIYTANITSVPVQGTTNKQRIGDKIHIQHLDYSIGIATAPAAGAYTWRVMVLWSGEEYNPAGTASGLGFTGIFLPNTGTRNTALGIVNPKAVTVLYDETVDINSIVAATPDVATLKGRIPIHQDFLYDKTGAVYGKTKNLYFVCIPYVVGGTTGATSCGDILPNFDMVFKPI